MLVAVIIFVAIVLIVIVQKLGIGDVELGSGSGTGTSAMASARMSFWDRHVRELGMASENLFNFLEELSYTPRCVQMLVDLPGMESIEREGLSMAINPRLGMIVYTDLIDCFTRLGHSPWELDNLEGVGLAMMVGLISSPDFDVTKFYNRWHCHSITKTLGTAIKNSEVNFNIEGCEEDLRFVFIFSSVYDEKDWTQRYRTLVYRWASLIAKADGTVTDCESEALAKIMSGGKLATGTGMNGNVRVSGDHAHEFTSSPLKAESPCPVDTKPKSKSGLESLDELIGLEPVKEEVRKLVSFIDIQRRRKDSGLRAAPISYHCVFTGNPGTGKTTVARILSEIYREMGVVKKGHLVETDRSGLVAEYVGQTAVKTNKIIDSALDGVLFIDEAYSLIQGGENDYGREAIATLLKRMEDDRKRLVVILAGYSDEMRSFIDSNPGLQSRFNRYIDFPDYNAEELAQIFLKKTEECQYTCNADVRASIVDIMIRAVEMKDRNFGNGRYVRNLFENAIQRQAVRLSSQSPLTTEMLAELTLHDLGFKYD